MSRNGLLPGQAAVFYGGDVVVGGGWIEGNGLGLAIDALRASTCSMPDVNDRLVPIPTN